MPSMEHWSLTTYCSRVDLFFFGVLFLKEKKIENDTKDYALHHIIKQDCMPEFIIPTVRSFIISVSSDQQRLSCLIATHNW